MSIPIRLNLSKCLNKKTNNVIETEKNELTETLIKYNKEYKLGCIIRNNIPWKYAECIIADDDEVLFSMWYRNHVLMEQLEGENKIEQMYNLIFHIVKNNNGVFLKYMNLERVDELEEEYAYEAMTNLGVYQTRMYGVMQKGYKEYVRMNLMKSMQLDKEEFFQRIGKLKHIDYDDLEFFDCAIEYECIDYCDYINKKYFYADGYCLDKYSDCIKFVDYILEKCDGLNINKSNIKIFKFEEKMEVLKSLINRKKEEERFYFE